MPNVNFKSFDNTNNEDNVKVVNEAGNDLQDTMMTHPFSINLTSEGMDNQDGDEVVITSPNFL